MFTNPFANVEPTVLVAYLDPGMASMQFQILLAAMLSATFFVKSSLLQVRHFFGRITRKAG